MASDDAERLAGAYHGNRRPRTKERPDSATDRTCRQTELVISAASLGASIEETAGPFCAWGGPPAQTGMRRAERCERLANAAHDLETHSPRPRARTRRCRAQRERRAARSTCRDRDPKRSGLGRAAVARAESGSHAIYPHDGARGKSRAPRTRLRVSAPSDWSLQVSDEPVERKNVAITSEAGHLADARQCDARFFAEIARGPPGSTSAPPRTADRRHAVRRRSRWRCA